MIEEGKTYELSGWVEPGAIEAPRDFIEIDDRETPSTETITTTIIADGEILTLSSFIPDSQFTRLISDVKENLPWKSKFEKRWRQL